MKKMFRPAGVAIQFFIILALLLATAGCASNKIHGPDKWADANAVPERRTVWTFAWGLAHQNIDAGKCQGPGLGEVTVKSNLGYSLISVLTLGIAMPVTIEWRCAKDSPTGGDDF